METEIDVTVQYGLARVREQLGPIASGATVPNCRGWDATRWITPSEFRAMATEILRLLDAAESDEAAVAVLSTYRNKLDNMGVATWPHVTRMVALGARHVIAGGVLCRKA